MIPILCIAALAAPMPATSTNPNTQTRPAPDVVFIASMGISIPINHNGLAFMVDNPGVAIEMFEPDARIDFAPLATLSEIANLHDFTIARTGAVTAVTLDLPRFPGIEGQFKVRYIIVRPDGATEFAISNARDTTGNLLLTQDPSTNRITVAPEDAVASLTLTSEDGAVRLHLVRDAPEAAKD